MPSTVAPRDIFIYTIQMQSITFSIDLLLRIELIELETLCEWLLGYFVQRNYKIVQKVVD
jgi:hypothetical protein